MYNYYDLLGVTSEASYDEIKKAYRELSIKLHPDTNRGNKYMEEQFRIITEAYNTLTDENKRLKYDFDNGFRKKNYITSDEIDMIKDYIIIHKKDFDLIRNELYKKTFSEKIIDFFTDYALLVNIKDLYGTIINKKEIQSLLFEKCPYCNELSYKDNKYCEICSMDKGYFDIEHYKKCPYCSAFVKKDDQTCINCKKNIADKIKHMYEYCPHCYNQSETIFNICEHCGKEKK